MGLCKLELAVLNNTHWYEAVFAAHGLAYETDGRVWLSHETPPPFYSNLVVLSPLTTQADIKNYAAALETRPRPSGWALKDSYACFDLEALGFSMLFQAEWIWRDPGPAIVASCKPRLSWVKVVSPSRLAEWAQAWSGDSRNEADVLRSRQFPFGLLGNPDHAFFAGLLEGRMVAGGVANRSRGVVGLSNLFSAPEFVEEAWVALVQALAEAFPGTPIVGYERGAALYVAKCAGFATLGNLRVWCRPA